MKHFKLILSFLFIVLVSYSQSVYKGYQDGKVYVQMTPNQLKSILNQNPRNISLDKFNFLEGIISKFQVTKISRPFAPANDDKDLPNILRIEFKQKEKVESLIEELQKINSVVYTEKIPLAQVSLVPNDALFSSAGGSVHLNQINAQNAWNISTGNSSITIAIVDNAVQWTHADLVGNVATNNLEIANNGIDDDNNGYVDDVNGFDVADNDNNANPSNPGMFHGTHCAGIAAASTNNNSGIASIGWNIKFIPVKCENDNGGVSSITYGFEGILYAAKARAKIISVSWVNYPNSNSQTEQSVINYAWNKGCLIFACAGNFSTNTPHYPAAYNHVYSVAAVDNTDIIANYSNWGSWVDIAAPGTGILSTVPANSYQTQSGTSMATPLVAGVAGLILSVAPNISRTHLLNCLSSSATNIYTLSGNSAFTGGLGAGRLNAYAALLCAQGYTAVAPQANFYGFPKKTCPNVGINFYDSSIYAPTSWSWVFQGGSPATSTLANPVVQWTNTGTYSVSLTVSNNIGSNSISKQSYISISNPMNLPFSEGFEGSAFLPSNWTENNIMNDEMYWVKKTGVGGYGTSAACAMFDNNNFLLGGERDEMRSPKFILPNINFANLKFDVAYARFSAQFSDSLQVKISTNCGITWTSIYLNGGANLATAPDQNNGTFSPVSTQWKTEVIDISSFILGQNQVMFSFINRGHYGQPIYLDNINLDVPTPSISVSYNSLVCSNDAAVFTSTITSGNLVNWTFQGTTPATTSINNPTINYSSTGIYTFSVSALNGTLQTNYTNTIQVINANQLIASASKTNATCFTCNDGQISIATFSNNSNFTYSWNPNVSSTANAINLLTGNYTVHVINYETCSSQTVMNVGFPDVIQENLNSEILIQISPNPSSKEIVIISKGNQFDYNLYDMFGRILKQEKNIYNTAKIDIEKFDRGIYFFEVKAKNYTHTSKLIFN